MLIYADAFVYKYALSLIAAAFVGALLNGVTGTRRNQSVGLNGIFYRQLYAFDVHACILKARFFKTECTVSP